MIAAAKAGGNVAALTINGEAVIDAVSWKNSPFGNAVVLCTCRDDIIMISGTNNNFRNNFYRQWFLSLKISTKT